MTAMGRDQLIRSLSELQGRYRELEDRNIALAAENVAQRKEIAELKGERDQYVRRVKEIERRNENALRYLQGFEFAERLRSEIEKAGFDSKTHDEAIKALSGKVNRL